MRRYALALAALLLAAAIYATAREGLLLHRWLDAVSLGGLQRWSLPEPVRNVLPDALWQFAFCLTVFSLWRSRARTTTAHICLAVPVVVGCGSELAQAAALIEGVFDPRDLVAMTLAVLVAWCLTWYAPSRHDDARDRVHGWPQVEGVDLPHPRRRADRRRGGGQLRAQQP